MGVRELAGMGREVLAGTGRRLSGRDLSAAAATLTYFAGIAVVPWLLLGLWSTTWWYGDAGAADRLLALQVLVPPDMGARAPYAVLVETATGMGLVSVLVLLLPASFYGEGIRRACLVLVPVEDRLTGWQGRLGVLPLLLGLVPLTWVLVLVGEQLAGLAPEGGGGGPVALLVRVLVGFTALWLGLTAPVVWVLRVMVPVRPGWVAALVGGTLTAACLAGFLHGFQLFLAIPIDVGIPFAGLGFVGGTVAVGLWLYVLHTMLLVGWTFAGSLDERIGGRR